jgi:hypothetical protein
MELQELEILTARPENRVDPRSPLMRAKAKALKGQKINVCPFGCTERNLDHNGYCKHVVGFTRDKKTYEPLVLRKGMRVVQVPMVDSGEMEQDDEGKMVPIMVPDPPPLLPGDRICRISDCWRVYRKVKEQQRVEPPKK